MTITTPTRPAPLASPIVAPTPLPTLTGNLPVCTAEAVYSVADVVATGNGHGRSFMTIAWTAFPAFGTKGHSQRTRPT